MELSQKDQIYLLRLDRRKIADLLGLSYDGLSRRLGGYTAMSRIEREAIQKIIDDASQQAGA